MNEIPRHKKRVNKKKTQKSNHKHDYRLIEKEKSMKEWFTHSQVCKICGKLGNEIRLSENE